VTTAATGDGDGERGERARGGEAEGGRAAGDVAATCAARAEGAVPRIYSFVFGRTPTPKELALSTTFLSPADPTRVDRLAHALLASNAFLFID
jgi:hypothetical protein